MSKPVPGTCFLCHQTLSGSRIRRHLLGCIESRTVSKPSRDPIKRDNRRIARKTAYLSVRAVSQPHWLELGVRCDVTLHELDRFLRGVWLECCGHASSFKIGDTVYSTVVPMPGEDWPFEPMDEVEARWRHMKRTINAAVSPRTKFEYEHDFGDPTELTLEYFAVFGDLAQAVGPLQPWHGGRIVILARNNSLQVCLRCKKPAYWRAAPEYDEYEEYDDQLYESEGALCEDDLDPIPFCENCAPASGRLVPLPNSPRVGVNCYDNVASWGVYPLWNFDQ